MLFGLFICLKSSESQPSPFSKHFHSQDPKEVFQSNLRALTQRAFKHTKVPSFEKNHGSIRGLKQTKILSYSSNKGPTQLNKGLIKTFDQTQTSSFFNKQNSNHVSTDDIIGQTRIQVESLKRELRSLTSNPEAAQILNKVFIENGGCFNNMDQAFAAIETSTKLFENAGTEIKELVKIVKGISNLTNTPNAVRESAKIIRLLDVLIPKLSPANSVCRSTTGEMISSLNSLAALVDELSSKNDLFFSTQKRQSLKSAAIIVYRVTDFLDHVQKSFSKFDHVCSKDKETSTGVLNMIGELMNDLALLYTALGGEAAAAEIRQQGDFVRSVRANINKLEDDGIFTLNCNSPGSTQLVAESLDDLAELIDEVGIDTLCSQLDLDCSALP